MHSKIYSDDAITVSSEIGVRKPDARIFMSALKSVSVMPEEAVFVSDELAEDLVGSKGLGMISVWLRNPQVKSEWKQREAVKKIFEPDAFAVFLSGLRPPKPATAGKGGGGGTRTCKGKIPTAFREPRIAILPTLL